MPVFYFYNTEGYTTTEKNIWVNEGRRYICITFEYSYGTGLLKYAASIYRSELQVDGYAVEPSQDMIVAHQRTTNRRFEIRPVIIRIGVGKPGSYTIKYSDGSTGDYCLDEIVKVIRYEMCHGLGCKGHRFKRPERNNAITSSDDSDSNSEFGSVQSESNYSTDSGSSVSVMSINEVGYFNLSQNFWEGQGYFWKRYYRTDNEPHGCSPQTRRDIFMCFKAGENDGRLVAYGASIARNAVDAPLMTEQDVEQHYKTAHARMIKCPVLVTVPDEFAYQLDSRSHHQD